MSVSVIQLRLQDALEGRYAVEHELGRGGMATVFLAEDVRHGRRVAIKVVEALGEPSDQRFQREILIAARLTHPNILSLHDSGEHEGLRYYVMPYVEGESLRDRLRREGALSVAETLRLGGEVAEALDFAHEAGIVHRDVKPENIMLHQGHATVADFGIASASIESRADLTATGSILGTPAYLSPEQIDGGALDGRSDLYSLACVLFECLTGEMPFSGTPLAVIAQRLSGQAPSARTLRPELPEALSNTLRQGMAFAPDDRHRTCRAFVAALQSSQGTTQGTSEGESERPGIVVLPFSNLSPDPHNEFLSDGLTEEILTDLASIHALRVISLTSSMRLKGTQKSIREIGRDLGVRYALQGSVRRAGDQLRITAQLIDAPRDEQIWAERFRGTMEDVFDVQERVAREIVGALDLKLTVDEDRRLAQHPVADPRAFELYLQARQEMRRYGPALEHGLQRVEQAMAIEGETIPLRALRAQGQIHRFRSGLTHDPAALDALELEARSILAEDPQGPYGDGLLGFVLCERGRNVDVVRHLTKALHRDPTHLDYLWFLALSYMGTGHLEGAEELGRRAVAADPLSAIAWVLSASASFFSGQAARALPASLRALELDPDSLPAHWTVGYTHALLGQVEEARPFADHLQKAAPDVIYTGHLLGLVAAMEGDRERALGHIRYLAPFDGHQRFHLGEVFALAGDHDRAMELLEQAVDSFHPVEFARTFCPFFEPVRGTARFESYVARAEANVRAFRAAIA